MVYLWLFGVGAFAYNSLVLCCLLFLQFSFVVLLSFLVFGLWLGFACLEY